MNEKEREIMNLIVEAHNKYVLLEKTHPSDIKDWVDKIHCLQDILTRKILQRDYPNDFPSYKDK